MNDIVSIRPATTQDMYTIDSIANNEEMDSLPGPEDIYVAVNDADEIVGFIRLQYDDEKWHVNPVVTYPTWRGFGVGKSLIDYARKHYGSLYLVARGGSVGFYRKLGFTEIEISEIGAKVAAECDECPIFDECQPIPFMIEGKQGIQGGQSTQAAQSAQAAQSKQGIQGTQSAQATQSAQEKSPESSQQEEGFALAFEVFSQVAQTCTECGACVSHCEVLLDNNRSSIGGMVKALLGNHDQPALAHIAKNATDNPQNTFAIRRCCMCSYCTLTCPENIDARATVASLRELLNLAKVTDTVGFESTQVDKEWHIFSVYRAVYGIGYQDIAHLEQARDENCDTLFFPGCTLASYAPDLTREICAHLASLGISAVISEECCGSPLKSAGFGERYRAFKAGLANQIIDAGIKRVVCVCPGCEKELRSASPAMDALEYVSLPQLLADKGCRVNQEAVASSLSELSGSPKEQSDSYKLAVFNSCFDREDIYAAGIRAMLPSHLLGETPHRPANALCCGAGGAASLVDSAIGVRRAQAALDEGKNSDLLLTSCPTCSYTLAYQQRQSGEKSVLTCNYLELIYQSSFDWDTIFAQLEGMWSGEYGEWVIAQLS